MSVEARAGEPSSAWVYFSSFVAAEDHQKAGDAPPPPVC
jgi:hypothetical protein